MELRLRILFCQVILPLFLSEAFVEPCSRSMVSRSQSTHIWSSKTSSEKQDVRVGDLLGDLPTPSLLLELSLVEGAIEKADMSSTLDEALASLGNAPIFQGALFVHTTVVDTSARDSVTQEEGSGKSRIICRLDTEPGMIPGGAYLGIGLANHLVGGYFWARGMGIGASLPAHGVLFNDSTEELYWKKRGPGLDAKETTEESSNSNDGKRSEWADFVTARDTVQLVPEDVLQVLRDSQFSTMLGVRRIGRPLGADPIVESIWIRSNEGWSVSK
jgi:hypothetical protein